MTSRLGPLTLFRRVAIAEAVTWALLLMGMFLKYVTGTTDLGVRIFGMVHGVVFIAYCLTAVVVAVDQRWRPGRVVLGLVSSVPPFMTIWFDRYAEARGALAPRWRLLGSEPATAPDRPVAWLLRNPVQGALAGVVAVAALAGLAMLVGPPAG
jgi:integral membrane protein